MPRQPRTSSASKRKSLPPVDVEEKVKVSYAAGFKPPSPKKIRTAIGFDMAEIPKEFDPGELILNKIILPYNGNLVIAF